MNYNNYNSDITIRELNREDLYDGIFVQSFGNTDFIYRLYKNNDDTWSYSPAYQIDGNRKSNAGKIDFPMKKDSSYISGNVRYDWSTVRWCETHYSRRFNLDVIREEKLNQIGI